MMQTPRSLRELSQELTGVRLSAANNSIWQIAATIEERARVALNDAIRSYPFWIRATNTSVQYDISKSHVVLPPFVEKVHEINAYNASDGSTRVQVTYWRHTPEQHTNLLRIEIPKYYPTNSSVAGNGLYWLTIDFDLKIDELPAKKTLVADLAVSAIASLSVASPAGVPGQWQAEGYVEFVKAAESANDTSMSLREIVYYNSINPAVGFNIAARNQLNVSANTAWIAASSVYVYPVVIIPDEMISVLMLGAQAAMYDYWVANRAMYDRYVTIANVAQIDVDELLKMVRTYELRAQERYTRIVELPKKQLPSPTRIEATRRRDIS